MIPCVCYFCLSRHPFILPIWNSIRHFLGRLVICPPNLKRMQWMAMEKRKKKHAHTVMKCDVWYVLFLFISVTVYPIYFKLDNALPWSSIYLPINFEIYRLNSYEKNCVYYLFFFYLGNSLLCLFETRYCNFLGV